MDDIETLSASVFFSRVSYLFDYDGALTSKAREDSEGGSSNGGDESYQRMKQSKESGAVRTSSEVVSQIQHKKQVESGQPTKAISADPLVAALFE